MRNTGVNGDDRITGGSTAEQEHEKLPKESWGREVDQVVNQDVMFRSRATCALSYFPMGSGGLWLRLRNFRQLLLTPQLP